MRFVAGLVALSLVTTDLVGASWATASEPLPPTPDSRKFFHLTTEDGLPDNSIRALLQDRGGFLWIGTANGLARYDGYELRMYRSVPGGAGGIGIRHVTALHQDPTERIWIGGVGGLLSCLDPTTDTFTNLTTAHDAGAKGAVSIVDIDSGPDSTVWVAFDHAGLARWNDETESLERMFHPDDLVPSSAPDPLTAMLVTGKGEVWLAFGTRGVRVYDPASGQWRAHLPDTTDPSSIPSARIDGIHEDAAGRIWLATEYGLVMWDRGSGSFRSHVPPGEAGGLERYLISITSDRSGQLWMGSPAGLYRFVPERGEFTLYRHDPRRPHSVAPGPVLAVLEDSAGTIWVGGWQAGLSALDPWSGGVAVTTHDPEDPESLDRDGVITVCAGRDGALWVGTGDLSGTGRASVLHLRRPHESGFTRVGAVGPASGILSLTETADGDLWIGTITGGWWLPRGSVGLSRPRLEGELGQKLQSLAWYAIAFDREGDLWVGTLSEGLFRVDLRTGTTERIGPRALEILQLHEDRRGRMWVGSRGRGVHRVDPGSREIRAVGAPMLATTMVTDLLETDAGDLLVSTDVGLFLVGDRGEVEVVTDRDGILEGTPISGLLRDGRGDLWVHLVRGVARLNSETGDLRIWGPGEGVPGGEPYHGNARGPDGTLYFATARGLVTIRPDEIRDPPSGAPTVITALHVNGERWADGVRPPRSAVPPYLESVVLPYTRNDLRIEFAALSLLRAERHRYRYRMEGVDRDWRETHDRHEAVYTNLDPGRYVFTVESRAFAQSWAPDGASLVVEILPPWWRTIWAYALYGTLALTAVVMVYRQLVQRERLRTALEIERSQARQLRELDELKSRFFANLSHEFRTPLTLIAGPLRRLREAAHGPDRRMLEMMERNTMRLGRLIDQLLDLSRLEAGRLPLQWDRRDVVAFVRGLGARFDSLAHDREIEFEVRSPDESLEAWLATDALEKIVTNLLANAFKFTPDGGTVQLTLSVASRTTLRPFPAAGGADGSLRELPARSLGIRVSNTGSYIPPEERERIFDRFHQLTGRAHRGGSGIGLALVRELVRLQDGSARVTSSPEKGTSFEVEIPVFLDAPEGPRTSDRHPAAEGSEAARPRILVIEDSEDMRLYLHNELADDYEVLEAEDGDAGMRATLEESPDLVLSDVVMPGMDGFELCRRLKGDERTSHVPVILLTARGEARNRVEGLSSGADDYLAKPFDAEELRARIRNLIETRRRLRERYARRLAQLEPSAMPVTSADERFLKRAREVVEEHLDDSDFDVEQFGRAVGMSRAHLLRKLKALTGMPPRDFVRSLRLRRAAELLRGGYGTVTEVAYAVGIQSPSAFAKRFREQYGVSPSEYASAEASDPD